MSLQAAPLNSIVRKRAACIREINYNGPRSGPPDYVDGPGARESDAACRAHCLKGDSGNHHGGHHPPAPAPTPTGPVGEAWAFEGIPTPLLNAQYALAIFLRIKCTARVV